MIMTESSWGSGLEVVSRSCGLLQCVTVRFKPVLPQLPFTVILGIVASNYRLLFVCPFLAVRGRVRNLGFRLRVLDCRPREHGTERDASGRPRAACGSVPAARQHDDYGVSAGQPFGISAISFRSLCNAFPQVRELLHSCVPVFVSAEIEKSRGSSCAGTRVRPSPAGLGASRPGARAAGRGRVPAACRRRPAASASSWGRERARTPFRAPGSLWGLPRSLCGLRHIAVSRTNDFVYDLLFGK